MKKYLFILVFALSAILADAQIIVSGEVTTNTTWTNDNIYILSGWVYVRAGATLTIEPGTVIKGDFVSKGALIIERDADIIADGTPEQPIVFTSQKAAGQRSYGDWGGLIICGKASVNAPANAGNGTVAGEAIIEGGVGSIYGGGANPDDDDSSGIIRYVRIEYGGIPFQPNSEINGLTMGGVGRGTIIENVQVSYCGDDAFEWFGGTVNCKNLVAYRNWDDDFDTDFGYTGKVQFALALRDPFHADQSGSNSFESDNDGSGTGATPKTAPVFSNVTIIGPRDTSATPISSNFRNAVHFRRNTSTSLFNSVISGFPTSILMDGTATFGNYEGSSPAGEIKSNIILSPSASPFAVSGGVSIDNFKAYFNQNNPAEIQQPSQFKYLELGLDPNLFLSKSVNSSVPYPANPSFSVDYNKQIGSTASFSSARLSDSFFQQVPYLGAFGSTDWTDTWAVFDPSSQVYP